MVFCVHKAKIGSGLSIVVTNVNIDVPMSIIIGGSY